MRTRFGSFSAPHPMAKKRLFTDVMATLERRIAAGDYMLKDLPGERRLAEETGVSYMTARKAVTCLIERGVLARRPNGTLVVGAGGGAAGQGPKVVLLTPAYPSIHLLHCRHAVAQAANDHGVRFRPVEYVHWYDPSVNDALAGADGVFVIPNTEPLPAAVIKAFLAPERKVVFLDDDMTGHGIPSVRFFAPRHVVGVFDHLRKLGHRTIDCLNVQGHSHEIGQRIGEWRNWLARHSLAGTLHDHPVAAYGDPTAAAYRSIQLFIQRFRSRLPSALVCTTQPAAVGAIRACHDAGLKAGEAISIAAINCEPTGRYFCPSLTGLETPDIGPLLEGCFSWFAAGGSGWQGPLLVTPHSPRLHKGESTGRALAAVGRCISAG